MENGKIFITIGIPTWNRCEFLLNNIKQITAEVESFALEGIELLISDNASDDNTPIICQELAEQYPFISYYRHQTNRGANANFHYVVTAAKGKYVWLLGDDDAIVSGSLSKIITDIKRFNYPAIVIGGSIREEDNSRIYLREITETQLVDETIFNRHSPLEVAGKISVLIFNTAQLQEIIVPAQKIVEQTKTGWPHIVWLLFIINQWHKLLILAYGTNYYLTSSQYNLLYRGTDLVTLWFADYSSCVEQLRQQLNGNFYQLLKNSITRHQCSMLLKCVAYSSFTDSYQDTLTTAYRIIKKLPGFNNKLIFGAGYLLPVLLPIKLRRSFLLLPKILFKRWKSYQNFMERILRAQKSFNGSTLSSQRAFRREWL